MNKKTTLPPGTIYTPSPPQSPSPIITPTQSPKTRLSITPPPTNPNRVIEEKDFENIQFALNLTLEKVKLEFQGYNYHKHLLEELKDVNINQMDFTFCEQHLDSIRELISRNERLLEMERDFVMLINELIGNYAIFNAQCKEDQTILDSYNNALVEQMIYLKKKQQYENSKPKQKQGYSNRDDQYIQYKAEKNELESLYIETEELLKKKARKHRRKEKERLAKERYKNIFDVVHDGNSKIKYEMKFVLVGDCNVGKTMIYNHYINGSTEDQMTFGAQFASKSLKKHHKDIHFQLWDINGSIKQTMLREIDGYILVFDITRKDTFDHIEQMIKELSIGWKPKFLLVGNKKDLNNQRQVSKEEATEFVMKHDIEYIEITAYDHIMVELVIDRMIGSIHEDIMEHMKGKIEHWTKRSFSELIFDSTVDSIEVEKTLFPSKVLNRSHLLFIISTEENDKFGCYVDAKIDKLGRNINDPNCFLFSLNRHEKYDILQSKYAIHIFEKSDFELLKIGDGWVGCDVCLYKERLKRECFVDQSYFRYGQMNALIGREGKTNPFALKRIVVFQMV